MSAFGRAPEPRTGRALTDDPETGMLADGVVARAVEARLPVTVRVPALGLVLTAHAAAAAGEENVLRVTGDVAPAAALHPDTPLAVEFVVDGQAYRVPGALLRADARGLLLRRPERALPIQRRSYFRAPAPEGMDVVFRVSNSPRLRPLLDLSGSGMGFELDPADADLTLGQRLEAVQIALGERGWLVGQGVVRHLVPSPGHGHRGRSRCGVEFDRVTDSERDRLVGWVLAREREIVRRGRG